MLWQRSRVPRKVKNPQDNFRARAITSKQQHPHLFDFALGKEPERSMRRLPPARKPIGEGALPEGRPEPLVGNGVAEAPASAARAAEAFHAQVP